MELMERIKVPQVELRRGNWSRFAVNEFRSKTLYSAAFGYSKRVLEGKKGREKEKKRKEKRSTPFHLDAAAPMQIAQRR